MYMLHNLNEQKLIQMELVNGNVNLADQGTNNLNAASHKKHSKGLCSNENDFLTIFYLILEWGMVLNDKRAGT